MPSSKQGRPARVSAGFRVRPLLGALAAAGIIAPTSLHAATIPVTTGGDAGNAGTCTLRQAVDSINTAALVDGCTNPSAVAFGTSDTVDLAAQSGTIALAGGVVPLLTSMAIVGPGATGLTISGGGTSRVFDALTSSIGVDIRSVTIANGRSAGPGGCILGPNAEFELFDAVVTGCTATHDAMFAPYLNGLGGGILAREVVLENSTVSGNTAQTAGGGVFALYLFGYQSLIAGNTVTGHTCNVQATVSKYCIPAAFGGGGVVGVSTVNLTESVVSGNTVNATTFTDNAGAVYRMGFGGGITQFKYGSPPTVLAGAGKSTVTGVRSLFREVTPATRAATKARAAQRQAALPAATTRARSKADGQGEYRLGLFATTLSGNRILGGGGAAPEVSKYSGGGAAFFSEFENAEIANSTVSGNTLPNGSPCAYTMGEPPFKLACGAGLAGDSVELTSSTVTGNVGATAVQFKYGPSGPPALAAGKSAKLAKAAERFPKLAQMHARWQQAQAKAGTKAVAKAASEPIFDSSIVAGNVGVYDVACGGDCTISGANNLVRTFHPAVTLPGDTISANPNLAPLANNGGVVAGAPGVPGTGPVRTHALYVGSPAIDAGSNIEGFEYDQRGPGFPRQVGVAVDIGAFEGAIDPPNTPVPTLGAAQLALLAGMLAASAAFLRRRRRSS